MNLKKFMSLKKYTNNLACLLKKKKFIKLFLLGMTRLGLRKKKLDTVQHDTKYIMGTTDTNTNSYGILLMASSVLL